MPPLVSGIAMRHEVCVVCDGNRRDEEYKRACRRLKEADDNVAETAKAVSPNATNDFDRGLAAARACGGAARKKGEAAAGCNAWREAVKKRAKACTALEKRWKDERSEPISGADGKSAPVVKSGAAEQVTRRGQTVELVGVVGSVKDVPSVVVNGEPATLTEIGSGGASAGPVSRNFKISVPAGELGSNIYVIEACEGAGNCFGRDVVVRVQE